MLRKRYIIECINDRLKNTAQIVHSRHRSINNFIMNFVPAITAYCFSDNKPQLLSGYEIVQTNQPSFFWFLIQNSSNSSSEANSLNTFYNQLFLRSDHFANMFIVGLNDLKDFIYTSALLSSIVSSILRALTIREITSWWTCIHLSNTWELLKNGLWDWILATLLLSMFHWLSNKTLMANE